MSNIIRVLFVNCKMVSFVLCSGQIWYLAVVVIYAFLLSNTRATGIVGVYYCSVLVYK